MTFDCRLIPNYSDYLSCVPSVRAVINGFSSFERKKYLYIYFIQLISDQTLEEAGYSEWSYTEPNNMNGEEYCGSVLKADGKLNDVNCLHKYAYICEKEIQN